MIIGAMIVAPLTRPIGALAFAAIEGDPQATAPRRLDAALGKRDRDR